jgi:hypothetical protein
MSAQRFRQENLRRAAQWGRRGRAYTWCRRSVRVPLLELVVVALECAVALVGGLLGVGGSPPADPPVPVLASSDVFRVVRVALA